MTKEELEKKLKKMETYRERDKEQIDRLNKEVKELSEVNTKLQRKTSRFEGHDLEALLKDQKEKQVLEKEFKRYQDAYNEAFKVNKKLNHIVSQYKGHYVNLLKVMQGTLDTHIFVDEELTKLLKGDEENATK